MLRPFYEGWAEPVLSEAKYTGPFFFTRKRTRYESMTRRNAGGDLREIRVNGHQVCWRGRLEKLSN